MVDMREHERESLLHPLLSEAQGPALVVFLRDVTLSSEDLVRLLHLRGTSFSSPNYSKYKIQLIRFDDIAC